jgi:hypothetical protein
MFRLELGKDDLFDAHVGVLVTYVTQLLGLSWVSDITTVAARRPEL